MWEPKTGECLPYNFFHHALLFRHFRVSLHVEKEYMPLTSGNSLKAGYVAACRCCSAATCEEKLEQALEEAETRGPSSSRARTHHFEADTGGDAAECATICRSRRRGVWHPSERDRSIDSQARLGRVHTARQSGTQQPFFEASARAVQWRPAAFRQQQPRALCTLWKPCREQQG